MIDRDALLFATSTTEGKKISLCRNQWTSLWSNYIHILQFNVVAYGMHVPCWYETIERLPALNETLNPVSQYFSKWGRSFSAFPLFEILPQKGRKVLYYSWRESCRCRARHNSRFFHVTRDITIFHDFFPFLPPYHLLWLSGFWEALSENKLFPYAVFFK